MQMWLNFWIFFFWLSLIAFFFNYFSFLILLLFSESTWIILYCFTLNVSCFLDDIILLGLSFILLGLAAIEFSIGILILILFKNLNFSLYFTNDSSIKNVFFIDSINYQYYFEYFLNK